MRMGFFFEQAPAEQPSQPVAPKVETDIQPMADQITPAEVTASAVEQTTATPEVSTPPVPERQENPTRNLGEVLPALEMLETASTTGRLSEIGRQIVEKNA